MINVNFYGGLLIILVSSFFMSVIFLGNHLLRMYSVFKNGQFLFVLIWIGYEYYSIHGKPGWPWMVLGNGLGNSLELVQWYQFTGVLGGSLWVLVINILLFRFLSTKIKFETYKQLAYTIIVFFIILIVPVFVSVILFNRQVASYESLSVLVVQSNICPFTQKFHGKNQEAQFNSLMALTKDGLIEQVDLIVWPETALDSLWLYSDSDKRIKQIRDLISARNSSLLFGAMSFSFAQDDYFPRGVLRKADTVSFVVSNSAILMKKDSVMEYRKNILVPGVETKPVFFHNILSIPYFAELGGVGGALYTDFEKNLLTLNDSISVIPVICFESAYGEHVAGFKPDEPFIIVVITNDGWFTKKHAYNQHLLMSRLRAIENGTHVIRSANTGKSTHIDKTGRIHEFLPVAMEGSFTVNAYLSNTQTFYARNGDFIGRISVFFLIMVLLLIFAQYLKFRN